MARLRDLSTLKGVGPKVGEAFARLGLSTLEDALTCPLRYEDRTRITPLAAVRRVRPWSLKPPCEPPR